MTSLLSPSSRRSSRSSARSSSRRASLLRLAATETRQSPPRGGNDGPATSTWAFVGAGGALVVALAGWVLVTGLSVVAWLSAVPGTLGGALSVGTELWLLANGAGAQLGSGSLTLVPWGVTLLVAYMISRVARLAARTAPERGRRTVIGVTVVTTAAYLTVLVAVAVLRGHALDAVRGASVTALVVAAAAAWGSSRGAGYRFSAGWPAWARRIPAAVLGSQLVLLGVGAAMLLVSSLSHLDRIESLLVALDPGAVGHVVLLVLQLAFLPNLVVWSASYALGAGFGLGTTTVIAPGGTTLGVVPGIPILGALPGAGAADGTQLWWLAGGVLAGVVAATVIVLGRPTARFDETSLVGGLAGAVSGAVFVGLAWLSGGDLGVARMVEVGPRLIPVAILGMSTLGLSGLSAGLVLGLVRGQLLPWWRQRGSRVTTAVDGQPNAEPEKVESASR